MLPARTPDLWHVSVTLWYDHGVLYVGVAQDATRKTLPRRRIERGMTYGSLQRGGYPIGVYDGQSEGEPSLFVASLFLAHTPLREYGAMIVTPDNALYKMDKRIIGDAVALLRRKTSTTTVIRKLLPPTFSLTDLQCAYACIHGCTLDKRNFRKKMQELNIVTKTKQKRTGVPGKPAFLYQFNKRTAHTPIAFGDLS